MSLEGWVEFLSHNDIKKLLEEMDKLLPKIRSQVLKRLCFIYKCLYGLIPYFATEFKEDIERSHKKGRYVDAETVMSLLKCSRRAAYDYSNALEFLIKCNDLETKLGNKIAMWALTKTLSHETEGEIET